MTVLKFKARVVARRYPKTARPARMGKPTMTRIYIGTVDTTGGAIILPALTPDMDVDALKLAIEQAELEKREAAKRESLRLRAAMGLDDAEKTGLS
jgi:hypothetical protein